MKKWNKVGRQARTWTAVVANVAKSGYYAARGWSMWEKAADWSEWWSW